MHVVIAGGHGKIALILQRSLAARGDSVTGLIRDPGHLDDVASTGASGVVLDLESADRGEVVRQLEGADAVVFAAGAGPGSGVARKDTVDRAAAVLLADAAEAARVPRFVQISAMGLDRAEDEGMDEVFAAYLRAKAAAERDLRSRNLDWTILRPGRLTDDPGAGRVHLAERVEPGEVSRTDVASVLLELLGSGAGTRKTLELVGGGTPVDEAVAGI
ncbi:NAD-dependent dehydratase [Actinoalloteichus sp. AHMU CJ021]|uniref:NAD(P)H-binding n=1 Tax=Actinoalloteichus caeruleus DSM 43889 TaxID=1120930 RepID=A0ABT1JKA1_ACTCY|nr:NAD(P)H-binding protein [Actinoalloteichus caeruleus]AUS78768.1 NAD-dependent dehydratase [Actinoalloteichus sp. AHMU CJ021]MCP2332937.1 NAD(P)H-binding [Actinoalloteichus caeruleus DSM 43889]